MQQIADWLEKLGMSEYAQRFAENDVDFSVLPHLSDLDLKELGVSLGHRRKMLAAIAKLEETSTAPAPTRAPESSPPLVMPTGTPMPEAVGERRHVTVMFCDLVDSTGIASKLDAEEWRDLVGAYLDAASTAVADMGGKVAKKLGDGLMALFGYPVAQENDAERAVRAALAIQRSLTELNRKNEATGKPALAARIAMDTGPVVVDATGEIFGEVPNIAARAQALAEPGSVVVTARVQRQVAGLFVAEERGSHELKGVPEPVTLFRLVRASGGGRRSGQRHLTPLVGRDEEIAMLLRRSERARQGDGQLVLIVGESGLGKSRLIEEFHVRLRDTPHTWVEWSCSQLLQNTPLHPVTEWGRQRFGGADVPAEQRLTDLETSLAQIKLDAAENAALLAPLLDISVPPERALFASGSYEVVPDDNMRKIIAQRLTLAKPTIPHFSVLIAAPEDLRRRQLGALMNWLIASAKVQPLVLAVEDLHWSDPTTLDLLRGLAERGARVPLFVLMTARPEFRPAWGMRSHHSQIALAPLHRDQVHHMIEDIAARQALPQQVVEGVTERTGGVPLFVEEVTRFLLERGEHGSAQAIPPTLQQSLMARLDRLGEAKEVAQIGAVIGRDFSYALLRAITGMEEALLQTALERLAEADILLAQGLPPEADYRFKHALILDVAYENLLKSRRQILHRRVAGALRDNITASATLEPELLAHHFKQAGMPGAAIEWWGKAGQHSLERSALIEAIAQFTRALDHIATLPPTPALRRDQINFQVALITPLVHVKGYAASETRAAVERAHALIEQAQALGEPPDDPLLLFSVLYGSWAANINGDVALDLATQFLTLAEKERMTTVQPHAHHCMGVSLLETGDIAGGRAHFDRAIALYEPAQHRVLATRFGQDARVSALSRRSPASWFLGYPDAGLADAERALSDAREFGQVASLLMALWFTSWTLTFCGHYVAANAQVDEVIALANEKGSGFWQVVGMVNRGWLFAETGRTADALQMNSSALEAVRSTGATMSVPIILTNLAKVYAELAHFDDAWRCISEALTEVQATKATLFEAELNRVAGDVVLRSPQPDPSKARAYFERALAVSRQQQAKSWELRAAMSMARLWRDQGKRDEARDLLAPVYGWFTEGFDTLDLKEARALLDELAA